MKAIYKLLVFLTLCLITTVSCASANGSDSDTEPAFVGLPCPAVEVTKYVSSDNSSWEDANTAGSALLVESNQVYWKYVVENVGDEPLVDVEVTDDQLDPGLICTIGDLGVGEEATCYADDYVPEDCPYVDGEVYRNNGTVNGVGLVTGIVVTDSDPSCYFGADPSVDIEKSTNGKDADEAPGPYIRLNYEVVWEFNVTNTGNVNLTDIEVTDDKLGLIGTIELLQPGESCVLTESGTASLGQYENNATAVGVAPIGPNVTDSDMSHYFGHDSQPNFEVPTANPLLIIGMLGLAGV
ncbi:DUF7507 domain-containing protein, partial [Methanohalophilus portucalensis]